MKNLFCIIILLFSLTAIADDVTISDFAACGVLLVDLDDPQLENLARMSLEYGITADQLFDQLPVQVQLIKALGDHKYALRAQKACKVLGITVDLNEELTT